MRTDVHRRRLAVTLALGLGGLLAAWFGAMPPPLDAGPPGVAATATLREAADVLAARHHLRIVIDPAVHSDVPAPIGPHDGAQPVEVQLQKLFAGHELVLHHTADRGSGARLVAAWVFARAEDVSVTPRGIAVAIAAPNQATAATAAAPSGSPPVSTPASPAAPQAGAGRGLLDADEQVRLQALQAAAGDAAAASPHELRRLVEQDASEAVRLQALESLAAHPETGDADLRQLLEQLAANPYTLLGEQARALREARAVPVGALAPEAIESPP